MIIFFYLIKLRKNSKMDFDIQIEKLKDDYVIKKYFNGKNLLDFMHLYIKIDKLLEKNGNKDVSKEDPNYIEEICDNLKHHIEQLVEKSVNIKINNNEVNDSNYNFSNIFSDAEIIKDDNNKDIVFVESDDKPKILICSKESDSVISKKDVETFYNDIKKNKCSGILCNAYGGIANKEHLSIDVVENNIVVFIHKHKYDDVLLKMGVNIIYNVHNIFKDKDKDSVCIDSRLFNNLKHEYNYFLQSYDNHLEIIKSNIEALSKLKLTLLDNFFKRKIVTNDTKPFSCHLCGTGFTSDKALKRHSKNQHQKTISTSKQKINTQPNDFENNSNIGDDSDDLSDIEIQPQTYYNNNRIDF